MIGKGEKVEAQLKVALLTREYPPEVYGGAGVHVEYLARELARLVDLTVHCWGGEREPSTGGPAVRAYRPWDALAGAGAHAAALEAVSIDLAMAAGVEGADARPQPHLVREPRRAPGQAALRHPARRDRAQPRADAAVEGRSSSAAATPSRASASAPALEAADAIIAVSREQARDVLACYPAIDPARVSVIYNGIDTEQYRPDPATDVLERYGVDPSARPSSSSAASRARRASPTRSTRRCSSTPAAQFVLCAGAPDTPEIAAEIEAKVARVRAERGNIVWIDQMLPREDVIQLLSHATVFLCPSIYEPLGIVNLEAMACETAVVATRTGGIPEVVEDGETGLLVPFEPRDDGSRDPVDPARFARDIAERVNELLADPARAQAHGGGRPRGAPSSASPGRRSRPRPSRSTAGCWGAD